MAKEDDESPDERSEAAVVVLGDVGRSPRMCNHAKMLADEGFDVKLIGFFDSIPGEQIMNHPRIKIVGIPPPPDFMDSLPAFVQLPLKLFWNFITLFLALAFQTSAFNLRIILMQNPPALPTMIVCFMFSIFKFAKFSIDWHNYMYSILQNKYQLTDDQVFGNDKKTKKAQIVRCVGFLEGLCGKLSDYNLCVTNAMRRDLMDRWGIRASTFYDRPPTWKFRDTTIQEIHDLYLRLSQKERILQGKDEDSTILTHKSSNGVVQLLTTRPIVFLSSTSWTPDERFEILLDALVAYDKTIGLPRVLMIITGKGPLKAKYLQEIHEKNLKNVDVLTPWLEAEDYPKILASADLGISLHTSTSGLDLPMKVVDMFGAKVPALALKFKCIDELVEEKTNGYLFDDSEQLSRQIIELSRGFPNNCNELIRLKKNTQEQKFDSWEVMWKRSATSGADFRVPDNGFAKLRAIIQFSFFAILLIMPIHLFMGTFSGAFRSL
ncbi:Chitobiosyldiphosphodolichol beta-mannosyltransferase [Caenorhabditis elegans]|uniref:Chitobiosyldiphosphodolichol beta-mannosyltransferase n=1 Tax=Caenorhabditis elegans TaxID=6239 RepID=Q22797_CAEEL|nr:Chitobiosyldiphosphodolichol beta-mannosyltransferase [Caenorhabditis elegans]CCD63217.1 Chitobiosyldiphosphodolichol beta-mannosyltransferase [Caenorhabditis elegans]|eukprot:NP_498420.2 Asparagine Linked Glycosylation (ALG) homolog, Nematode [Caenorhabditis elegans]